MLEPRADPPRGTGAGSILECRRMDFEFDSQALIDARRLEHEHYEVPSFDGLSDVAMDYPENQLRVLDDPELQRTYLDALMDLHLLVDEYRFSALLAVTLLRDYVLKRDRGDAPELHLSGEPRIDQLPWPAEAVVVMQGYAREPPSASELFDDPHQQISGGRILSRWFAAQLIDSALYRGIAACDRMAILLRCQARLPVELTRRGERRQPSFTLRALTELEHVYSRLPGWDVLIELSGHPLFDFVKELRNGFTHERRRPSELHGERPIAYGSRGPGEEEIVGVLGAEDHYLLAPAFYNEVMVKTLDATRLVITASARKS
jgi:hypothetical protein